MEQEELLLPVIGRAAQVRPDSVNDENRTVEVVWTTGAVARRWTWEDGAVDEELDVSANAVRMGRLNAGAPFLNSHDQYSLNSVIGVVESARIEGGRGIAVVRFSDRDEVEPVWRDVRAGIIRNISVGYRVHEYEITKREGAVPLYRAVDWEPMELSAVAIGADPGAHFRSENATQQPCVLTRAVSAAMVAAHPMTETAMENTTGIAAGQETANAEAILTAERTRAAEITSLCQRHEIAVDRAQGFITSGATVDSVRAAILDMMAESDAQHRAAAVPARVVGSHVDETETRRTAMEDAIVAGVRNEPVATLSEAARQYHGFSMVDLAAERLGIRRVTGGYGAREEVLRRAFHTTSDFPYLFENAMNRSLASRYQQAAPTYRQIARQRTYVDFRDHTTVRMGDAPMLQLIGPQGGEIKAGTFGEAREKTAVKPYGVRVDFSRQMMVDDSLGGIAQVIDGYGDDVARFEETTFYAMMLGGANADGPTLLETSRQVFNATDATKAGSAAAIGDASLALARAALRKRTGLNGAKLTMVPTILLVGPDKETEADKVVTSIIPNQTANVNIWSGKLRVVVTAEITGNAWYVFADRPCFEWGLLQGYEAPRLRTQDVFGTQGTAMTLEHDFGCGAIDFRGGYKNAGA